MPRFDRVHGILSAAVFALGISCFCTDAQAQRRGGGSPVRVEPQQDLVFGVVIPGVETRVGPTDATCGFWRIKATNNSVIDINFLSLPPAMNSAGDSMPVRFESNQALVVIPEMGTSFVFDPAAGISGVQLGSPGRAFIYLGGVASPRGDQAPGAYQSPVMLDVIYANNAGPPM